MKEERIQLVLIKESGEGQLCQHQLKLAEAPNGKSLGRACSSEPLLVSVRTADWRRYQDGRLGIHSPDSSLSVWPFICVLVSAFGVHSFTARRGAWECKPGKLLCLGLNLGSAPIFAVCSEQVPASWAILCQVLAADPNRYICDP